MYNIPEKPDSEILLQLVTMEMPFGKIQRGLALWSAGILFEMVSA